MAITYQELQIEGHTIAVNACNEAADGLPAVFIHGILTSIHFWNEDAMSFFTERGPWYALSLPGHYPARLPSGFRRDDLAPETIARVLTAAVRQLVGDRPVLLVGHSTGGFAVLAMAAQTPELAQAVISISGFAQGRWGGPLRIMQDMARMGLPGALAFRLTNRLSGLNLGIFKWSTSMYTADKRAYLSYPGLDSFMSVLLDSFRHTDQDAMLHYFNRMPDIDISDWLSRITAPTLVMTGDSDIIVPPQQSSLIAQQVPYAELALIQGAGHMPMAERREQYESIIANWVTDVLDGVQV